VFSGEQGVSIAADRDGRDDESTHLVALDGGRVIGTCRLLFRGNVARLGRLAVDPDRRGEGIAAALLALADRIALEQGADSISLHAQTYARRLYLDAGYEERGPAFVEEGIEHVAMGKRLQTTRAGR
jgi:predicted GNAT family N-acyltransferase